MKSVTENQNKSKIELERIQWGDIYVDIPRLNETDANYYDKNLSVRAWLSRNYPNPNLPVRYQTEIDQDEIETPPWELPEWENGSKSSKKVNGDSDSKARQRLGNDHGNNFYFAPRAFSWHMWIFRSQLTPSERDILHLLLSVNGDAGIIAGLGTLYKYSGIKRQNLAKHLKELSRNDRVYCPICKLKSSLIETNKRKSKIGYDANSYDITPFLEFLTHLVDHFKNDKAAYDKAFDEHQESRKQTRSRFETEGNQF
jgi:hypothetical protein